jgi:hypothetical protein
MTFNETLNRVIHTKMNKPETNQARINHFNESQQAAPSLSRH